MVEGDGFEIRCTVYGTEGSNPSLSVLLYALFGLWRDVRAVEGAPLEGVWALTGLRGFESLSLRISPLVLMIDSVLSLFAQPRQDRKVAAASE